LGFPTLAIATPPFLPPPQQQLFFFFITFEPRVEWYTGL